MKNQPRKPVKKRSQARHKKRAGFKHQPVVVRKSLLLAALNLWIIRDQLGIRK